MKKNVPVDIIRYSLTNGLRKPLALFLAIKFYSSGKLHASDLAWNDIKAEVNIKDPRTFKKHLNCLRDLGWIGYNPASDYYFVRSFERIRAMMGFKKRTSAILPLHDLSRVQSWCDGVLISCVIRDQEFYWVKGHKRFKRSALRQKDGASPIQRVDPKTKPAYYGLCSASNQFVDHRDVPVFCSRIGHYHLRRKMKIQNCQNVFQIKTWILYAGFGSLSNPPLIAIYSQHDKKNEHTGKHQTQSIAYSLNNGKDFTVYDKNPVRKMVDDSCYERSRNILFVR